ncbi:MAG: Similar to citrate lyase beta chain, 2, partial [uncultured Acidimicrobiales bacterium]
DPTFPAPPQRAVHARHQRQDDGQGGGQRRRPRLPRPRGRGGAQREGSRPPAHRRGPQRARLGHEDQGGADQQHRHPLVRRRRHVHRARGRGGARRDHHPEGQGAAGRLVRRHPAQPARDPARPRARAHRPRDPHRGDGGPGPGGGAGRLLPPPRSAHPRRGRPVGQPGHPHRPHRRDGQPLPRRHVALRPQPDDRRRPGQRPRRHRRPLRQLPQPRQLPARGRVVGHPRRGGQVGHPPEPGAHRQRGVRPHVGRDRAGQVHHRRHAGSRVRRRRRGQPRRHDDRRSHGPDLPGRPRPGR